MSKLKTVGLSFDNAPLEIREMVTLDESGSRKFLGLVRDYLQISEAFVLSTCNRTEIYYLAEEDFSDQILKSLQISIGRDIEHTFSYFFSINDQDVAIKRLFEICIGLRSQIMGDMQITNQLKHAYQWSTDERMAGPFLHRLLHTIFFTNKKVVQETAFRDGAASISYVAKELVEEIAMGLDNPVILVIGAGEISRDFCDHMQGTQREIYLTNRTHKKAEDIATKYNYKLVPFDKVTNFAIDKANIIISSISKGDFLFQKDTFEGVDLLTHKYFVDLSVPRSVDPSLQDRENYVIYSIDELKSKADEVLKRRQAAIPHVRQLIDDSISEFNNWSQEMIVSPTINRLKEALEQIRREELSRYLRKVSKKENELLEQVTKNMMQKILKLPVLNLKAACRRGDAETLIDVLNDLFDLEKKPELENKG